MRADRPNFGPVSSARSSARICVSRNEGVPMSASVPVAEWIKRIADDERRRDAVRVKEDELTARKADLVRRNGGRMIEELRAAVTRDLEAFRDEFPGDPTRDIVAEATPLDTGF